MAISGGLDRCTAFTVDSRLRALWGVVRLPAPPRIAEATGQAERSRLGRFARQANRCRFASVPSPFVQPFAKKYFGFSETQITAIFRLVPSPLRGAYRDRHGRRARDAVDASRAFDDGADLRTAKTCGPDAPTLASSRREATFAGDGGKKARSPGRARYKR